MEGAVWTLKSDYWSLLAVGECIVLEEGGLA